MTATIQKWGNSQGIRIPKIILDSVNWSENEKVTISVNDDAIIIRKSDERRSIAALFDGFDGEYITEEIDWGQSVGEEVW
ncbi:MAG: AbrB/MazE/SpoVT family DNA-binding domain-containing protein [Oscillospiraceae bacterium]|nr:AbrB/MazE/SpoVT family DNA-binding domain-containing protein [Oscillospiraceae bacterium]